MYHLHTQKQFKYFDEVIRLHYEEGYGEDRISQLLPIGHTTASRWIAIFAKEKGKISGANDMRKPQENASSQVASDDVARLQERVKELDAVASMIPCVQVSYCLAPAFFRIGILNLASATLIISS